MNDASVHEETSVEPTAETRAEHPPILFLHGIDRHYRQGDVTLDILKNAELAIWPGQSVALVAPSGAGKSTLLHIAGLLEHPDAGEVYLDQVATSRLSDAEVDARRAAADDACRARFSEAVIGPQLLRALR